VRFPVLADLETRRNPLDCEVNNGSLIGHGLNRVCCSVLRELEGEVIGIEIELIIADVDIL
jgi:hypothetical protein